MLKWLGLIILGIFISFVAVPAAAEGHEPPVVGEVMKVHSICSKEEHYRLLETAIDQGVDAANTAFINAMQEGSCTGLTIPWPLVVEEVTGPWLIEGMDWYSLKFGTNGYAIWINPVRKLAA